MQELLTELKDVIIPENESESIQDIEKEIESDSLQDFEAENEKMDT